MAGNYGVMNRRAEYVLTSGAKASFALENSAANLGDILRWPEAIEIWGFFLEFTGDTYQTGGNDLVVTLWKRATNGSDSLRVSHGTITVPHVHVTLTGPQEGTIYRNLISPFTVLAGEEVVMAVTTAYGGSGPNGDFYAGVLIDFHPEIATLQTNIHVVTA
jgi:hypothetical protein